MKSIPSFDFVIEDSPECHQSLKYWNQRSKDVRHGVSSLASSLGKYHSTGLNHKGAGDGLSDALSDVAKSFKDDPTMEDPLNKFSDAISRIECYREMLLNQTNMLGMQPLNEIARYIRKAKDLKHQVSKANETLHSTWDRFSNVPNQKSLQEPAVLDKAAHAMLTAKENYQMKLTQYIQVMREIHTVKKMAILQKVLEHMLAQFSFFNFSNMVLKEIEPYMSEVFDSITKRLEDFELLVKEDCISREDIEKKIDATMKEEKKHFPEGTSAGFSGSSTMQAINASTGRFFTKFGGMIASGVHGVRSKTSKDGPPKPPNDQEWEVVEDPSKKSNSLTSIQSREDNTGFINSAEELSDEAAKDKAKASQFYLALDETGNNVLVRNAGKSTENESNIDESTSDKDKQIQKHHDHLDADESVVSLTELLEAETKEETTIRSRADSVDPSFKMGYLRIKKKGTLRSSYPLLYIILDKKKGNLLMQGEDEENPTLLSSLMLSAVKECDPDEAERNFCFQVLSATKEMTFQAVSTQNMKEWMQAIQEGISSALMLSQERIRTIVRSKSQKETKHAKHKKQYASDAAARIRAVAGNKSCADCSAARPDWASINIGVVFCIECSGMHRGLGVHVSKVKSLTLDRWEEDFVKHMEETGNAKVNSILEGKIEDMKKLTRESSKDERRKFITAKYVERRFALPSETDEIDMGENLSLDSNGSDEDEDDLFKDIDEEDDLFGTSVHSSIVCLVKGCKDCEKDKMEKSNRDASAEFDDRKTADDAGNGNESESDKSLSEAGQTESTC